MYATPVVYVIPKTGIMKTIMEANPLTPIIQISRDLLVGGNFSHLNMYVIVLVCSVPFLFLALVFYRISIPIIVERMSA